MKMRDEAETRNPLIPGCYRVRPGLAIVAVAGLQIVDGADALLDAGDFRRLVETVLVGDNLKAALQ
jgi:hypothetical protein